MGWSISSREGRFDFFDSSSILDFLEVFFGLFVGGAPWFSVPDFSLLSRASTSDLLDDDKGRFWFGLRVFKAGNWYGCNSGVGSSWISSVFRLGIFTSASSSPEGFELQFLGRWPSCLQIKQVVFFGSDEYSVCCILEEDYH